VAGCTPKWSDIIILFLSLIKHNTIANSFIKNGIQPISTPLPLKACTCHMFSTYVDALFKQQQAQSFTYITIGNLLIITFDYYSNMQHSQFFSYIYWSIIYSIPTSSERFMMLKEWILLWQEIYHIKEDTKVGDLR